MQKNVIKFVIWIDWENKYKPEKIWIEPNELFYAQRIAFKKILIYLHG